MQATLDAIQLKTFVKALTCLSKYGDEFTFQAKQDMIVLSTTNSSMSAYCRFRFDHKFFAKYTLGGRRASGSRRLDLDEEDGNDASTAGQLVTKSLLSVLRHRAVEKTVDRCELTLLMGGDSIARSGKDGDEEDSLAARLSVRMHCKHGVVKTHRLLLQEAAQMTVPVLRQDAENESSLSIGTRPLKDIMDRFPYSRSASGGKQAADPQLVWTFDVGSVNVKTVAQSGDGNGRSQLSTELTIEPDEFDDYNIYDFPTTIAFHLREFNATVSFAESLLTPLGLRFTASGEPLIIDLQSQQDQRWWDSLAVISTTRNATGPQPNGNGQARRQPQSQRPSSTPSGSNSSRGTKRGLDDNDGNRDLDANTSMNGDESFADLQRESMPPPRVVPNPKRPRPVATKIVQSIAAKDVTGEEGRPRFSSSNPPPPTFLAGSLGPALGASTSNGAGPSRSTARQPHEDPLFFPGSQLSMAPADEQRVRAAGLGIEDMDEAEFLEMLGDPEADVADDDNGVDGGMDLDRDQTLSDGGSGAPDSFDIVEDFESAMAPTQQPQDPKSFKPLFED